MVIGEGCVRVKSDNCEGCAGATSAMVAVCGSSIAMILAPYSTVNPHSEVDTPATETLEEGDLL